MVVLRAVHAMAARTGGFSLSKASGQRERLRAVEPARTAIRPEVALRIVVRQRLTDEERKREVLVAIARLETEEDVVLVPVTIAAGVEHLPRRGPKRREDFQLHGRRILRLGRRILLPLAR